MGDTPAPRRRKRAPRPLKIDLSERAFAMERAGAFRRFKDTLLDHPAERERWFAFQKALQIERAREWLVSIGVQPLE